jgi:hypothetical protein
LVVCRGGRAGMSEVSERLSERIAREWCDYADAHSDGFDADPDGLVATFCAAAIEQAVRAERERGNRLEAAMRKIEALQSHCECWDISGVALRAEAAIRERAGGHPA